MIKSIFSEEYISKDLVKPGCLPLVGVKKLIKIGELEKNSFLKINSLRSFFDDFLETNTCENPSLLNFLSFSDLKDFLYRDLLNIFGFKNLPVNCRIISFNNFVEGWFFLYVIHNRKIYQNSDIFLKNYGYNEFKNWILQMRDQTIYSFLKEYCIDIELFESFEVNKL